MDKTTTFNMILYYIQAGDFRDFFILVQENTNTKFIQTLTLDELYEIKEHLDFAIQKDDYAKSIYVDILKYNPNAIDVQGCYQVQVMLFKITLYPSFETPLEPVIVSTESPLIFFQFLIPLIIFGGLLFFIHS